MLAADGELGRIWWLSRPLTYRSIDTLVERKLLTAGALPVVGDATARCCGRPPPGAGCAGAWLDRPVDHLRDVRTELLLKLACAERSGLPGDDLLRPDESGSHRRSPR